MANLSDAFGTIKVEKVGKEFLKFLNEVQGDEAYYVLVEQEAMEDVECDEDGDLALDFSTFGRWNYGSNIEGYLNGEWMSNSEENKKSYKKFISALKRKNGSVTVEYTDSDACMDWMGTGVAELLIIEGEVQFSNDFNEENVSIKRYAELYQYNDEIEAMESLHGDEVSTAYCEYIEKCKSDSKEPLMPNEWYGKEYQEE